MAAAAVLGAVGSLVGGLTGAFSQQSRSPAAVAAPRVDTSTAAIATAPTERAARRAARNAERERMIALVTDPQVMGLLTVIGGLALSTRIPFHEDPMTNARIQGVAATCCVLMGLGRAGVGDITTMMVAGGAGLAVASGESPGSWAMPNIPGTDIPAYVLTGPGSLVWGIRELAERV